MFVQVGRSGCTSVIGNVLVNADVAQGDDAKAKEEARCFYLPAIARLANERQLASGQPGTVPASKRPRKNSTLLPYGVVPYRPMQAMSAMRAMQQGTSHGQSAIRAGGLKMATCKKCPAFAVPGNYGFCTVHRTSASAATTAAAAVAAVWMSVPLATLAPTSNATVAKPALAPRSAAGGAFSPNENVTQASQNLAANRFDPSLGVGTPTSMDSISRWLSSLQVCLSLSFVSSRSLTSWGSMYF
jgi:hypothetical protein